MADDAEGATDREDVRPTPEPRRDVLGPVVVEVTVEIPLARGVGDRARAAGEGDVRSQDGSESDRAGDVDDRCPADGLDRHRVQFADDHDQPRQRERLEGPDGCTEDAPGKRSQ